MSPGFLDFFTYKLFVVDLFDFGSGSAKWENETFTQPELKPILNF